MVRTLFSYEENGEDFPGRSCWLFFPSIVLPPPAAMLGGRTSATSFLRCQVPDLNSFQLKAGDDGALTVGNFVRGRGKTSHLVFLFC